MSRAVARLKHYTMEDDKYLIPKMFDRWKMLIKLRKLVKHWLHFIANRQKPIKADLSVFFNRWKYKFGEKQVALSHMTREELQARCVKAAEKANHLARILNADNNCVGHLLVQRDELLDNYKRSQRLALSLGKENMDHALMKSWSRGV